MNLLISNLVFNYNNIINYNKMEEENDNSQNSLSDSNSEVSNTSHCNSLIKLFIKLVAFIYFVVVFAAAI